VTKGTCLAVTKKVKVRRYSRGVGGKI